MALLAVAYAMFLVAIHRLVHVGTRKKNDWVPNQMTSVRVREDSAEPRRFQVIRTTGPLPAVSERIRTTSGVQCKVQLPNEEKTSATK